MSTTETFHGWACYGKDEPLQWQELPLRSFDMDTVELQITHCGICGSDIHTLDSGWGPTDYPCVVGHEITGVVTRVGDNVKGLCVGDRAGVGAQSGSCLQCAMCHDHNENLCLNGLVGTYNSRWQNGDKSFGGYADKWRGHQHFVFKLPDNMSNEKAATFFCAGVTTYSPLRRFGVKPGDKVGVIGIGGLGHFAVQWAKAMGASVVAISSSERKRQDAEKLGCDDYIVIGDSDGFKKHACSLSHIVCSSFGNSFDWKAMLSLIRPNGYFIMVALPETPLSGIPAGLLALRQISLVGSAIGSPDMIRDMLDFAAQTGVQPWLNAYPMSEAPQAVKAMRQGKARYRIVLENSPAAL